MVTYKDKQILINEKPVFLSSGELHYFRQPRENWRHLLDEAKVMGLNCISSYVPWLLHEEIEGNYSFEGRLDLGAFIDLCKENGFYFFARPGPFVMAEMKNEGLPYWVAKKHPDSIPVGFDGNRRSGTALDYLHPGYLDECRKWYGKVMKIISPRLFSNGGNVIGVQLDNEIGMLNWITNQPLLNDNIIRRFSRFLSQRYKPDELMDRYHLDINDIGKARAAFRSPAEEYSVAFHFDYGLFMRQYYADYVNMLRKYAEESGIRNTPFFINIHGTGGGRIYDFPLGLSQLYEAYNRGDGMISGTDVYLGEPVEGNYQDLYVINALTDCMNKKGRPLTSVEFECSDGPYCSMNGMRWHPSATSHKMLMCVSQNARMLNFYIFSGGVNYPLAYPGDDGNGRMAFTGGIHGNNAPVQPDGSHNYAFGRIAETAGKIHALNKLIASSRQKTDNVTMAFIPDYFLTEAAYPPSEKVRGIFGNLEKWRCSGSIDSVARALLGHHVSFDAVDIQNGEIPSGKTIFLLSARYMSKNIQKKLSTFILNGGKLLLYGELPEYDLEGAPCACLMDTLRLSSPIYLTNDPPSYFLTYNSCGRYGNAAPAQRGTSAQCFPVDGDAVLSPGESNLMCGMLKSVGKGKICAITCDYPADMGFYGRVFQDLSIKASLAAYHYRQGIYLARTESSDGQQLIYIINLDAEKKSVDITMDGETLFKGFALEEKASHILPVHFRAGKATVVKSTAEITAFDEKSITFRVTQPADEIVMKANLSILPGNDYEISIHGEETIIHSTKKIGSLLTVKFG